LAGYAKTTMAELVSKARREFLTLWHEHETPRYANGKQLIRRDAAPIPCGSRAAYSRHLRRKERCEICKAASTEYMRVRRAALRASTAEEKP
jgi:hypothetical protein